MRSEGQFNTIIYEEHDTYRYKAPRDALFLNREDMARVRPHSKASRVTIASDSGQHGRRRHRRSTCRAARRWPITPKPMCSCGTAVDPRSKTPAFKSVPVWIEA